MSADSERSTDTPSTDPINHEANRWLHQDESGRLSETRTAGHGRGTRRTAQNAPTVQALAARLGRSAEDVASSIPEDTLRRCKYPVIRIPHADGSVSYERDVAARPGLISSYSTDFSHGKIDPASAPKVRDEQGRFSK